MVSALLPIKERARVLILEATAALQPYFSEITAAWRKQMFAEFAFEGRAMLALERLNLGTGFALFSQADLSAFSENLQYFGTRLAKLQIDTRAVARSFELYQELCVPYIREHFGEERQLEILGALETLYSVGFVAISGSYYDTQSAASSALLEVLDAELSARNLSALLERVLSVTIRVFDASAGAILLIGPEINKLRVKASVGLEGDVEAVAIEMGQGFSGHIAATGEPDILPDLAQSHGLLNPMLRTNSQALWGVPLKTRETVIGVLLLGFPKSYVWLPSERDLLRAICERSALAIERAGMMDALREREARIAELSGHLLKAQEEERKHFSRELHDETGQALMVIRLYLGMLEKVVTTRVAKAKIQELFEAVDRTIEGVRRIIGRLSPLVLQELGLIAAIRKEAKDLAKSAGVRVRVVPPDNLGRLAPEVETAIYRVVQESLHNIAKHAKAHTVAIEMKRTEGELQLVIADDGIGINQRFNPQRPGFGLAGMQQRIKTLGGTMQVDSQSGEGTRITVVVPISAAGVPPPPALRVVPTVSDSGNGNPAQSIVTTGTHS